MWSKCPTCNQSWHAVVRLLVLLLFLISVHASSSDSRESVVHLWRNGHFEVPTLQASIPLETSALTARSGSSIEEETGQSIGREFGQPSSSSTALRLQRGLLASTSSAPLQSSKLPVASQLSTQSISLTFLKPPSVSNAARHRKMHPPHRSPPPTRRHDRHEKTPSPNIEHYINPAVIPSPPFPQLYPRPSSQNPPLPSPTTMTNPLNQMLYDAILQYRGKNGLGSIPMSSTMQSVAVAHVIDLIYAPPIDPFGPYCNAHSWYSGTYACCFDESNYTTAPCMWYKPPELTCYQGNGYEILSQGMGSLSSSEVVTAALQSWEESSVHNAVILNQAPWNNLPWLALGCTIGTVPYPKPTSTSGFWVASCWFGFEEENSFSNCR
ncbi:hypothetical protein CEUSTIGMA_g3196.t1 [Chlamydomonas eustigma]|uniref:SCP domain-containing protein n=1 Tax=Chlamydomonas eustigma TaxID=1157962 RepID=A0A250WY34_9CHLO|nr:hypothetical protein CEUSTIGMA_g3196.t1 [Chlamydomonas eustigma]|eukprot:GAX75753.1 hypothetical protein CEUSTIGMA_g3196.t1 [Chlamydomonas eustigma]